LTDYPIDEVTVDAAVVLVDRILGSVSAETSRRAVAEQITAAVLPEILIRVEMQHQDALFALAQARDATAHVRSQLDVVVDAARKQSARLRMVFEEINPAAVADLIIGEFEGVGHRTTRRDVVLIRATVAQTVKRTAQALGLALSADLEP